MVMKFLKVEGWPRGGWKFWLAFLVCSLLMNVDFFPKVLNIGVFVAAWLGAQYRFVSDNKLYSKAGRRSRKMYILAISVVGLVIVRWMIACEEDKRVRWNRVRPMERCSPCQERQQGRIVT